MREITVKALGEELSKLRRQYLSDDTFLRAKALYMDKVVVVDDMGSPIPADQIDILLTTPGGDEPQESVEPKAIKFDSAEFAKTLAVQIGKHLPATNKVADGSIDRAPARVEVKGIYGDVRAFDGASRHERASKAYRFGTWLAASRGVEWAQKKARDLGIQVKAHTEGVNSQGGFLVPEEFSNDIIRLVEEYGVFRRNARVRPMSRDVLTVGRRTGGLTAYFPGEASAITESTNAFDRVTLTAKKLACITTASNELMEDAIVSIGDFVALEVAFAFANKEDDCGFNGDGTATYGGIVGARQRLSDINGVDDGGGLVLASGNLYSEITATDIAKLIGRLPQYANANAKFYCSQAFFGAVLLRLQMASGGVSYTESQNGRPQPRYFGIPVEIAQVMPTSEANSQVCLLYGDLSLAASFGDRRQVTMAVSDSALNAFEQDEMVIRGTERFDINVHDIGDSSNAGPLVGLITQSS